MTTSVTINVHCGEDASFEYFEHHGVTWLRMTSSDGEACSIFGPSERLRRLFTEALRAIPEPAVAVAS